MMQLESSCIISYQCLMVSYGLTLLLYEIQLQAFKILHMAVQGNSRASLMVNWIAHISFPISV